MGSLKKGSQIELKELLFDNTSAVKDKSQKFQVYKAEAVFENKKESEGFVYSVYAGKVQIEEEIDIFKKYNNVADSTDEFIDKKTEEIKKEAHKTWENIKNGVSNGTDRVIKFFVDDEDNNAGPFKPIRHQNAILWSRYIRQNGEDLHGGVDISGEPAETSIYPLYPGVVEFSGWNDGYGWVVKVKNSSGEYSNKYTTYGHMHQRPNASLGQEVDSSTILGGVGNTGHSEGVHLHIDIADTLWAERSQRYNIDHIFLNFYRARY